MAATTIVVVTTTAAATLAAVVAIDVMVNYIININLRNKNAKRQFYKLSFWYITIKTTFVSMAIFCFSIRLFLIF